MTATSRLALIVLTGILVTFSCGDSSVGPAPIPDPTPPVTPPPPDEDVRVNVRDFGARGDGVANDALAFEAALAELGSAGGTLFVPAGTYMLEPARSGAIEISNRSNVTVEGDGLDRTILRMAPATYPGATHVILLQGVTNVIIRDLTLDGNKPNAIYQEQQAHGVEVRNSSDLRFERMRFMHLHSDGIRLVGRFQDTDRWTERVVVQNSRFEDTGRSGVGMQRAVGQVQILNNTFDRVSNQSISSEPGGRALGDVAPRDILMEGNVIHCSDNLCVALEGVGTSDLAQRLTFRNNRVENGHLKLRAIDDLRIEGNVINGGPTGPALELPMKVTNVQVIDNEISGAGGGVEGLVQVIAKYDVPDAFPSHVTLSNNRIRATGGQAGVLVRDALGDVTILENEVHGQGGRNGIQIQNEQIDSARSGFIVRDNVVRNFENGIIVSGGRDHLTNVEIANNSIDHDQTLPTETVGIVFAKTGPYQVFATVIANLFGAGVKIPILVRGD